jgi:hypothetical protein
MTTEPQPSTFAAQLSELHAAVVAAKAAEDAWMEARCWPNAAQDQEYSDLLMVRFRAETKRDELLHNHAGAILALVKAAEALADPKFAAGEQEAWRAFRAALEAVRAAKSERAFLAANDASMDEEGL